ncbi:MAG: flavodoxin [Oscillospiraceae bacterium]|nr:flavodoxin [Oscillospiraceae bacterium]
MNHIAVIYWSGTGNTEAMAKAVLKGAGVGAELFSVSDFDESKIDCFDAFALGCPAMGSEALEDGEFEPFFENVKASLAGKKVALFGSCGWGDGEWMRSWEDSCAEAGITLAVDSVICNDAPDSEALEACKALGAALA